MSDWPTPDVWPTLGLHRYALKYMVTLPAPAVGVEPIDLMAPPGERLIVLDHTGRQIDAILPDGRATFEVRTRFSWREFRRLPRWVRSR